MRHLNFDTIKFRYATVSQGISIRNGPVS